MSQSTNGDGGNGAKNKWVLVNQVKLLLWKNYVLKKRHLLSTLSEILLPIAFVLLVVWLQTLDPDKQLSEQHYTCPRRTPLSPTVLFPVDPDDHENFVLELSTEGFGPGLMTVPPLAYLSMIATKIEHVFALVPGNPNDPEQLAWLDHFEDQLDNWTSAFDDDAWQSLSNFSRHKLGFGFCRFKKLVKRFESAEALEKYVKGDSYGTAAWPRGHICPDDEFMKSPRLHMALILDKIGTGDDDWAYTIQTNFSVVPLTYPKIGLTSRINVGVNELYTDQYMMSGFLTMQQAVDRVIINKPVGSEEDINALALQQVCDSIDPLRSLIEKYIPSELLHDANCTKLLRSLLSMQDIDLTPFTAPVRYAPNNLRIAEFPTPAMMDRPFYRKIKNVFGLDLVLTFLWPISRLIRGIVHEKETRSREGMRMMGLRYSALYWSWFLTYGLLFFVISAAITAIAHVHLFSSSDPILIFAYFFLFCMSIIAYCFMVSVLFNRAKTASTAGVVLFFVGFFPFFAVNNKNATASAKTFGALLSPTAFGIGASTIATYEAGGLGVRWSNAFEAPNEQEIPFMQILGTMVLDLFIYLLLTFYLDQVIPQEFGVARPWNFLCTRRFWSGSSHKPHVAVEDLDLENASAPSEFVEDLAGEQKRLESSGRCVKLDKLTKVYNPSGDDQKVAVDQLDLTMLEGEIFVLLGHNGAGKTTTINLLTGLLPHTGGRASVFDCDIGSEMDEIRQKLGVCPQHDVLFPELTVEEHLQFFASLKRVKDIGAAVDAQITHVGLDEKRHVAAANLSGGQKRKLSVAIALLGDSKFIVVDEPTSGVDPWSRRAIWQVLQESRQGRVILLTTHFMDEADMLGDRIAIMADGRLQCCGTSLFLKSKYGIGYTLTFSTSPADAEDSGARSVQQDNDRKRLGKAIQKHIPDAEVYSSVGSEVAVRVPFKASKKFPELFEDLDSSREELRLASYGVSVTTLEEVFLKVASQNFESSEGSSRSNGNVPAPSSSSMIENGEHSGMSHGTQQQQQENRYRRISVDGDDAAHDGEDLVQENIGSGEKFGRHFRALFLKRYQYAKRDNKSLICNTFLPIVLLVMGLALLKAFPMKTPPALVLDVAQFKQGSSNIVPYNATSYRDGDLPLDFGADVHPISAAIKMDRSGTCPGEEGGDIPDGVSLAGLSDWVLDHRHSFDSSLYGAVHFDQARADKPIEVTLLVNSTAKHGPAVFMNLIDQALARHMWSSSNAKIQVTNHPFPFTSRFVDLLDSFSAVSAAISIVIAFSFVPASVAIFVVKEREISAKHQQLISGASTFAYWLSSYVWDMVMYLVPCFFSVLAVYVFKISAFEGENFGAVAVLFFLYGLAVMPFTYVVSFMFASHSTAQNVVLLLNFITGLVLLIASFVMSFIDSTRDVNRVLKYIFRMFPGFCLGNGLLGLTVSHSEKEFLPSDFAKSSPFDWDVTGKEIVYLLSSSVFYFSLTICIDVALSYPWVRANVNACQQTVVRIASQVIDPVYRVLCCCGLCARSRGDNSRVEDLSTTSPMSSPLLSVSDNRLDVEDEAEGIEDKDVAEERDRVNRVYDQSNDVILLNHLRKQYPDGKLAVRGLSFGIPAGEVFGFLGLNGAGKTTTMKMLTGDILPSSGTAKLVGKDVIYQQGELRRMIGYCPQFDALLENLTVREHLELYARIKCIPEENVARVAKTKMRQLNLDEFSERTAGKLSGGNRRKLSVAIAMVGSPPLIFIDEASTGIDAYNRRFLLDVIAGIPLGRHGSRKGTVVLTSHSMEEVESLCSQVGIMVGGQFSCFGSLQHLKSRFGKGLLVNIKLRAPSKDELQQSREKISALLEDENLPQDALQSACEQLGHADLAARITPSDETGSSIWSALERSSNVDVMFFLDWFLVEELHHELMQFLQQEFTNAECVERRGHHSRWRLQTGENKLQLGKVFSSLEDAKEQTGIVEYAVSMASLESIFLSFAAQQASSEHEQHQHEN